MADSLRSVGLQPTTAATSPSSALATQWGEGNAHTHGDADAFTYTHADEYADQHPHADAFTCTHARDASGQVVQPVLPYTVTITYGPIDLAYGDAIESTLALYRWSGTAWVQEPTSRLDAEANTVTATPKCFSTWAVLGEARSGGKVYLPLLTQSGP